MGKLEMEKPHKLAGKRSDSVRCVVVVPLQKVVGSGGEMGVQKKATWAEICKTQKVTRG